MTRLYKAQYVYDDLDPELDYAMQHFDDYEPEGWREYAIEKWGEDCDRWDDGYQPFFMPSDDRIYRSRSAAQARVNLINRWGGTAVLMECTPVWDTVSAANARRENDRILRRVERKYAEIAALEAVKREVA
ncbi:hypothetical protein [Microbacterium sp.]|uniref:hypothetical protein n=1 Tax=Microbacterium sp. TaxID=51671 RepID=UPI002FE2139F